MPRYERAKMWPTLDKLCRLCEILGCTADSLLGADESAPRPSPPPPAGDSPIVRRLLRRLRKARPRTVRLVKRMLADLERAAAGPAGKDGKGAGDGKGADDGTDDHDDGTDDHDGTDDETP